MRNEAAALAIAQKLSMDGEVKKQGDQFVGKCPYCTKEDHLYIGERDDGTGVTVYCQRCNATAEDIIGAAGLKLKDLYYEPLDKVKPREIERRQHLYHNPDGSTFGCKTIIKRDDGTKKVYWERYEGGKFVKGLNHQTAPLFNVHRIGSGQTLFFVEGEKDTETVARMDLPATSAPNGGGQTTWHKEYDAYVKDKDIVVLTDNDDTGRKYGRFIARSVFGKAQSVRIIPATAIYPAAREKWDVTDISEAVGLDQAKRLLLDALEVAEYLTEPPTDPEPDYTGGMEWSAGDQTGGADQREDKPRFLPIEAADAPDRHVNFLWYPYLPRGEYVLLAADGGTGKSFLTCGIAAAISTGAPLLGDDSLRAKRKPGNVLFISSEDSSWLFKNRLRASGADLHRCHILDSETSIGLKYSGDGYAEFAALIKSEHPDIVFIDPFHAFIDENVDLNRINQVRPVFQKLAALAKEVDTCFVLIVHKNKRGGADNLNNGILGSTDLVNAARSVLQVKSLSDTRRIMVHTKSNYAAAGKSVEYEITGDKDNSGIHFIGFSDVDKELCETAELQHKKLAVVIEERERERSIDTTILIDALREICPDDGSVKNISYDEMRDKYGNLVFLGQAQPRKALEKVELALSLYDIETYDFGKQVKYNGKPRKGFSIRRTSIDTDAAEDETEPEQQTIDVDE